MNTFFRNNDGIKIGTSDINIHKAMKVPVDILKKGSCLLYFNQKMHVRYNFKIIYDYHFLINLSQKLQFLKDLLSRYIKF